MADDENIPSSTESVEKLASSHPHYEADQWAKHVVSSAPDPTPAQIDLALRVFRPNEDWDALARAIKQRRAEKRLPQNLTGHGGPGAMTMRKIEQAETTDIRGKTKTQIEAALGWPAGQVDAILSGNPDDTKLAGVVNSTTALATGLLSALAGANRTPVAEVVYRALVAWLPELS